ESRRRLVRLVREHQLLVLSDDVYELLHFSASSDSGPHPPRLVAFDHEEGGGHVISNGSFSKVLGPGVRCGWIEAREDLISRLQLSPFVSSAGASAQLVGAILASAMQLRLLDGFLHSMRATLSSRTEALHAAFNAHAPVGCSLSRPSGGMCSWLQMPPHVDSHHVLIEARKQGVSFKPAAKCGTSSDAEASMYSLRSCSRVVTAHYDEHTLARAIEIIEFNRKTQRDISVIKQLHNDKNVPGSESVWQPNAVQVVCILKLLGGSDKIMNHLAEVPTGEGKPVIIGVLATTFALYDFHVDCVCYSSMFSSRDCDDFMPMFEAFKVIDRIRYGTFDALSEDLLVKQHGDPRKATYSFLAKGKSTKHAVESRSISMSVTFDIQVLQLHPVDHAVLTSGVFLPSNEWLLQCAAGEMDKAARTYSPNMRDHHVRNGKIWYKAEGRDEYADNVVYA
ncbi:MAG: hypothetical protein SGPRY_002492, partial [Prymnesium sp.]